MVPAFAPHLHVLWPSAESTPSSPDRGAEVLRSTASLLPDGQVRGAGWDVGSLVPEVCTPRKPLCSVARLGPVRLLPSCLEAGISECETPFPKFSLKHKSQALSSGLTSAT